MRPGWLADTEDAIRHNDQGRAAAAMQIYGESGFGVEPTLDLMLKYAVSEDGRLHGEKYFHTVREEYRTIRPSVPLAADCGTGPRHQQRLRLQPRRQSRLPRGGLRGRLKVLGVEA